MNRHAGGSRPTLPAEAKALDLATMPTGKIISIVYTPDSPDYQRPEDRYVRTPVESVTLVVGKGIQGDRKGKYKDREINLMSVESQRVLAREGFKASPGELGEQIAVEGIDVDQLKPGDRIQLGATAVLEVDKPRTGCDRFEHIQARKKSEARGRLGQMMRVVESGEIRVGDEARSLAR